MSQLLHYLTIFKKDVAQHYRKHEETFDLESFHGRFHIIRCLVLIDKIDQFYISKGISLDVHAVYYAILFHDIAREGNGYDEWEEQSATKCYNYLIAQNKTDEEAFEISRLILKEFPLKIEGQIVYDVDVLDYNRFFWLPEEESLFDKKRLRVASKNDVSGIEDEIFRTEIIKVAQQLVMFSEKLPISISTEELTRKMYEYYLSLNQ